MRNLLRQTLFALLFSTFVGRSVQAQVVGWRNNWTGLYPEAAPPLVWERTPLGPMEGIRCAATRPLSEALADPLAGSDLVEGTVTDWLITGPFSVPDARVALDVEQLPHESELRPALNEKAGATAWKLYRVTFDPWAFGEADLPWLRIAQELNGTKNCVAYAVSYVRCEKAGKLRAVLEHYEGMKVWVNGKTVYRSPQAHTAMGSYQSLGRRAVDMDTSRAAIFEFDVKEGWNTFACKVASAPQTDRMQFCLRLMDVPTVAYRTKNIAWMSEIPNRSNATPILVKDRIFIMSEPDELICYDRKTGKKLWSARNALFQTLTPADRAAEPRYAAEIDPLYARMDAETDPDLRIDLRRDIQQRLEKIDKRFHHRLTGHLAAHFGIVGFTTPTPCSDGEHVYAWLGNGVAACYDLEGHRAWCVEVPADHLAYACSPALVGDKFVVFMEKLVALRKSDGAVVWEQPAVDKNSGAVQPAKLAGVDVIVSQPGEVVRASDGHVLWVSPQRAASGDQGWAPPVVLGNVMYLPYYGVSTLSIVDFANVSGDAWKPAVTTIEGITINRKPDGSWLDRFTAASPLIYDGISYDIDLYATYYGIDLAAKKTLFRAQTDLHGFFHYNSIPIAASPTLGGNHIFISDNMGTTLVLEPGREYHQVGKNHIGTVLPRTIPLPGQEAISYSPPVFDGKRIYMRGERYLYCIEEESVK